MLKIFTFVRFLNFILNFISFDSNIYIYIYIYISSIGYVIPVRLGENEESRAGWNRLFLGGHVEFGHSSWPGRYSLLRSIVWAVRQFFHEKLFYQIKG